MPTERRRYVALAKPPRPRASYDDPEPLLPAVLGFVGLGAWLKNRRQLVGESGAYIRGRMEASGDGEQA